MDTQKAIALAKDYITDLSGHKFDVLDVSMPVSAAAAINLTKIISKVSPLVGNLIEFSICDHLNNQRIFEGWGSWQRQDPGFPDTVFRGSISPTPGLEIKAWFPLSTEITARFKDSQNHFLHDQTYVSLLAWLPENIIFGKPKLVDSVVISGLSIAAKRDQHYHNPPHYLVLEPEDTAARTINLQQTNTNGFLFQGDDNLRAEACQMVASWEAKHQAYTPTRDYRNLLNQLIYKYPYRLDTNYAKIDRIDHPEIEAFKRRVQQTYIHGRTIGDWQRIFRNEIAVTQELQRLFGIGNIKRDVVV